MGGVGGTAEHVRWRSSQISSSVDGEAAELETQHTGQGPCHDEAGTVGGRRHSDGTIVDKDGGAAVVSVWRQCCKRHRQSASTSTSIAVNIVVADHTNARAVVSTAVAVANAINIIDAVLADVND